MPEPRAYYWNDPTRIGEVEDPKAGHYTRLFGVRLHAKNPEDAEAQFTDFIRGVESTGDLSIEIVDDDIWGSMDPLSPSFEADEESDNNEPDSGEPGGPCAECFGTGDAHDYIDEHGNVIPTETEPSAEHGEIVERLPRPDGTPCPWCDGTGIAPIAQETNVT